MAIRWSPARLRTAYQVLAVAAVGATVSLTGWGLPLSVALAHLPALPFLAWGGIVLTRRRSPFPAVAAMVVLAGSTTLTWWWIALRRRTWPSPRRSRTTGETFSRPRDSVNS